jgi:hypothetical protein
MMQHLSPCLLDLLLGELFLLHLRLFSLCELHLLLLQQILQIISNCNLESNSFLQIIYLSLLMLYHFVLLLEFLFQLLLILFALFYLLLQLQL